jgi:hypothetical protein
VAEVLERLGRPLAARALEGEAQEPAFIGGSHRTLSLIDLQLEALPEEPRQTGFDALARPLAVDPDKEVGTVAGEVVAASFQFCVQVV